MPPTPSRGDMRLGIRGPTSGPSDSVSIPHQVSETAFELLRAVALETAHSDIPCTSASSAKRSLRERAALWPRVSASFRAGADGSTSTGRRLFEVPRREPVVEIMQPRGGLLLEERTVLGRERQRRFIRDKKVAKLLKP